MRRIDKGIDTFHPCPDSTPLRESDPSRRKPKIENFIFCISSTRRQVIRGYEFWGYSNDREVKYVFGSISSVLEKISLLLDHIRHIKTEEFLHENCAFCRMPGMAVIEKHIDSLGM